MTCHACGGRNERGARFCKTCGAKIEFGKDTRIEYENAVLPEAAPKTVIRTATLSKLSLVLGLLSLTPLTLVAGIPAVIAAVIALRQRRPGAKRAYAGLLTGAFGSAVLTFALGIPFLAGQQELARVAKVKANMKQFQAAMERYSTDHEGAYPSAGISWSSQAEFSMAPYFKEALIGEVPLNPYTGTRYEAGRDLYYLTEALTEYGLNAVDDRANPECPFVGLAAPGSQPGSIVILGHCLEDEHGVPVEYAIVGYGRETTEPLARKKNGPFVVLHN